MSDLTPAQKAQRTKNARRQQQVSISLRKETDRILARLQAGETLAYNRQYGRYSFGPSTPCSASIVPTTLVRVMKRAEQIVELDNGRIVLSSPAEYAAHRNALARQQAVNRDQWLAFWRGEIRAADQHGTLDDSIQALLDWGETNTLTDPFVDPRGTAS